MGVDTKDVVVRSVICQEEAGLRIRYGVSLDFKAEQVLAKDEQANSECRWRESKTLRHTLAWL